jgi:hypothetical protein
MGDAIERAEVDFSIDKDIAKIFDKFSHLAEIPK